MNTCRREANTEHCHSMTHVDVERGRQLPHIETIEIIIITCCREVERFHRIESYLIRFLREYNFAERVVFSTVVENNIAVLSCGGQHVGFYLLVDMIISLIKCNVELIT